MPRYKCSFIALEPNPTKINMCLEADSVPHAWKIVCSEFRLKTREWPNKVKPQQILLPEKDEPHIALCPGCPTCQDQSCPY